MPKRSTGARSTPKRPKSRKITKAKRAKPWTAAERLAFLRLSKSIPQQVMADLAKRGRKQLDKQGDIYDLAFGHGACDLGPFLQSLFELLARIAPHYSRWMRTKDESVAAADQRTPQERWQTVRALRAEFELEQLQGTYIRREDVHEGLAAFAAILRDAGDRLQRQCGAAAYEIHQEALDSAVKAVRRVLKDDHGDNHKPP